MIKQLIKRFFTWVALWMWKKPVSAPEPPKATEVIDQWVIVIYHGQKIQLHKNELQLWAGLDRKAKRGMAKRFEIQEKKGMIRFEEINGKLTCIKNKNYGA